MGIILKQRIDYQTGIMKKIISKASILLLFIAAVFSSGFVMPKKMVEGFSFEEIILEDGEYSPDGLSTVKIHNRTDWKIKVYIDGNYVGKIRDDSYGVYTIYSGRHRVVVYWPNNYHEWFDFSVCNGCGHKIWTSDYDG